MLLLWIVAHAARRDGLGWGGLPSRHVLRVVHVLRSLVHILVRGILAVRVGPGGRGGAVRALRDRDGEGTAGR